MSQSTVNSADSEVCKLLHELLRGKDLSSITSNRLHS